MNKGTLFGKNIFGAVHKKLRFVPVGKLNLAESFLTVGVELARCDLRAVFANFAKNMPYANKFVDFFAEML